jgi:Holliday junction resolvasome RuvABC endonuclease subunit
MCILLGLDQSLTSTGVCVAELDNNQYLTFKQLAVIKTKSKESIPARLSHIKTEIEKLVFIYQPNIVFLEDVYTPRAHFNAWSSLLGVRAVLSTYFYENNIQQYNIPVKEWRKTTGYTDKSDYLNYIRSSNTDKIFSNEHVCESIGVLIGGIYSILNVHTILDLPNVIKSYKHNKLL